MSVWQTLRKLGCIMYIKVFKKHAFLLGVIHKLRNHLVVLKESRRICDFNKVLHDYIGFEVIWSKLTDSQTACLRQADSPPFKMFRFSSETNKLFNNSSNIVLF